MTFQIHEAVGLFVYNNTLKNLPLFTCAWNNNEMLKDRVIKNELRNTQHI